MAQTRTRNVKLARLISDAGLSHDQLARAVVRVAEEVRAGELLGIGRSHVTKWVAGIRPSGRAPEVLCEALSRRVGRPVTLDEIGLVGEPSPGAGALDWGVDTLVALADLGRIDVSMDRRGLLGTAAYSLAALTVPAGPWWSDMGRQSQVRASTGTRAVGRGDLEAVRDMASLFTRVDQRRGGGHARTAVVQYLTSDVAAYLRGRYADDQVRREMFSAAGELAYLCGWMAFDNAEHATAQVYLTLAVKLAAEADDSPLAGHVLRALAHQAVDLGHPRKAMELSIASLDGKRYTDACPRERALLGVVHARALAAAGVQQQASVALIRAESDLANATPGDEEPGRVFFFGEASLAHETACTLRDLKDSDNAIKQFRRSVAKRKAATFTRTHAVTLGYLGAVQLTKGSVEEACATWSKSLDAMDGVRSGRTRQAAKDMRSLLSPLRGRGIRAVADVDARAAAYLAAAT